jgi:hypothetical protein
VPNDPRCPVFTVKFTVLRKPNGTKVGVRGTVRAPNGAIAGFVAATYRQVSGIAETPRCDSTLIDVMVDTDIAEATQKAVDFVVKAYSDVPRWCILKGTALDGALQACNQFGYAIPGNRGRWFYDYGEVQHCLDRTPRNRYTAVRCDMFGAPLATAREIETETSLESATLAALAFKGNWRRV